MSMISEQVKELREYSELCLQYCNEKRAKELLKEAADTIEALSAKLAAANMERSDRYYGGGWIACEDRMPEEHKLYDITFENSVGIHSDSAIYNPYLKRWLWDADKTELVENKVLAWAEKREPYHP